MEQKIYLNNTFTLENAAEDSDRINIVGYACKYNQINLNSELVDSKSFDAFFGLYNSGKLVPFFNWEHTDSTIGGIDKVESDSEGLIIKAHLIKDVAIVRDMIGPLVMSGDLNSFSTEGSVLNGYDDIVTLPNDKGYYVKNFILRGVSVVRTPACPDAKFSLANYIKEYEEAKLKEAETIRSKWYLLV